MPCDTAKKWFVLDRVWKALNEDYALVNVSASSVREDLSGLDDDVRTRPAPHDEKPITFEDYSKGPLLYDVYGFLRYRSYNLIYADVDDTKPEHRQMLVEQRINDEPEETEGPDFVALRDKYAAYMSNSGSDKYEYEGVAKDMDRIVLKRVIDHETMDFLLGLSAKDQELFLQMASGQNLTRNSRPVMLLLHMIDTKQTTTMGSTEGYIIALDVVNNRLIIKPFHSDKDTHPLTKSWDAELPNDGISFSGTPLAFARSFLAYCRDTRSLKLPDPFKFFIHGHVVEILLKHWTGFAKDFVPDVHDYGASITYGNVEAFKEDVQQDYDYVQEILAKTDFPVKEKPEDEGHKGYCGYRELEQSLRAVEDGIRQEAMKLKAAGDVRIAGNAAKVYERILGILEEFNEDPAAYL